MRHTVIVSDIHLWEAHESGDAWMRYRRREYFPDAELARMFDAVLAEVGDGELDLVLNGDVFDFDVAPPAGSDLAFGDPPRTAAVAIERLASILDDHPVFVDAVARVIAAGHRVVFVSGNHDAQMTFPEVREVLARRLVDAALALHRDRSAAGGPSGRARDRASGDRLRGGAAAARSGGDPGPSADLDEAAIRSRVVFRAWFHRTPDGVHVEHGNQYDRYCSFRYPMLPFRADAPEVAPTVGSLVMRYIVGRLGYFNPNEDSTFLLSPWGYVKHWARYYLLTRRSLAITWALGTFAVAAKTLASREQACARRAAMNAALAADETGADPAAVAEHMKLFAPTRVYEVARVLQLDRAALGALALCAAATALLSPATAAGVALGGVGAVAAFNIAVPNPDLNTVYGDVARCARAIAAIHDARAVVFGHTHVPYGVWDQGRFYGNCGTWSPRFRDPECTQPFDEGNPVVWLRTDDGGALSGGLYRFRGGMLLADTTAGELPAGGAGDERAPRELDAPRLSVA